MSSRMMPRTERSSFRRERGPARNSRSAPLGSLDGTLSGGTSAMPSFLRPVFCQTAFGTVRRLADLGTARLGRGPAAKLPCRQREQRQTRGQPPALRGGDAEREEARTEKHRENDGRADMATSHEIPLEENSSGA